MAVGLNVWSFWGGAVPPFDDGWNRKEDARKGGGMSHPFKGRSETIWITKLNWPTPCVARLIIREYEDGRITAEPGRVWVEDDGA